MRRSSTRRTGSSSPSRSRCAPPSAPSWRTSWWRAIWWCGSPADRAGRAGFAAPRRCGHGEGDGVRAVPFPFAGSAVAALLGASGALAALATGLARIGGVGLAEAARALLTALLGLLLGVVPVAELSGIVLISHRGTPWQRLDPNGQLPCRSGGRSGRSRGARGGRSSATRPDRSERSGPWRRLRRWRSVHSRTGCPVGLAALPAPVSGPIA